MRVIFIDRDGTILSSKSSQKFITRYDDIAFIPGSLEALNILINQLYYQIIIVSNQAGIAQGYMDLYQCWDLHREIISTMAKHNINILDSYICPHDHGDNCLCRKPKVGLLDYARRDYPNVDIEHSVVVGDRLTDIEMAQSAHMHSAFIRTGVDAKVELDNNVYNTSSKDNLFLDCQDLLDFVRQIKNMGPMGLS